jgi:hypothetical protein
MRQQELVGLLADYEQLLQWMNRLKYEVEAAERRWAELGRRLRAATPAGDAAGDKSVPVN